MTRKTKTPDGLIPEPAIERAPEPVRAAQAAAVKAHEAKQEGAERLIKAREARDGAPDADAAALAEAARAGVKPPSASEPALVEEAKAAQAAYDVLKRDATQAIEQLHRTVAEHNREAIKAQRPVVEAELAEAMQQAERLADRIERLSTEDAVLASYYGSDAFKVSRGGRRKTLSEVGRLRFTRPRPVAVEARKALQHLASALRGFAREDVTAAERQLVEEQEREERPKQPGLGRGIYVGG